MELAASSEHSIGIKAAISEAMQHTSQQHLCVEKFLGQEWGIRACRHDLIFLLVPQCIWYNLDQCTASCKVHSLGQLQRQLH